MQTRHRGQPLTGHSDPEPITINLRALAIHILVRAARDATGNDPYERAHALRWLNSEEGRGVAQALGVCLGPELTVGDLNTRERNTYFRGG